VGGDIFWMPIVMHCSLEHAEEKKNKGESSLSVWNRSWIPWYSYSLPFIAGDGVLMLSIRLTKINMVVAGCLLSGG
jgi:hypothetical protein